MSSEREGYSTVPQESQPQGRVEESQSKCQYTMLFVFLVSLAFGGILVYQVGEGGKTMWFAVMWFMALFTWFISYWQRPVINSFIDLVIKLIDNVPCQKKEFADANLTYEVVEFMQRYRLLATNVLTLGTFGLAALVAQSAKIWQHHWLAAKLHEDDYHVFNADRGMGETVSDLHDCCAFTGMTPMPYAYLFLKIGLVGFLQDLVFHTKNVSETVNETLGRFSKVFVAYQIATQLATFANLAWYFGDGKVVGGPRAIYEFLIFKITQSNSNTNIALLACKMWVETNISEKSGSAHSFDRLERYRVPAFTLNIAHATKPSIFWLSSLLLALVGLPVLLTHIIPACIFTFCALTFPFWGMVCLVMSYFNPSFFSIVCMWAQAHAQVWGIGALFTLVVLISMLAREQLWRIQCYFAKKRVDGTYGYTKATMVLYFAVPTVFVLQSFPMWAMLAYSGHSVGSVPFEEYNLRTIPEYNSCFLTSETLMLRVARYFALV